MDFNKISKQYLKQNIPLPYDLAFNLGKEALRALTDEDPQSIAACIALLVGLHTKATYGYSGGGSHHSYDTPPDASEQIAGVCAAIMEGMNDSFITTNQQIVVDNCGMGGDYLRTANVSTLSALIAASSGRVKVCKHGSPGNADAGRQGSSDFINELGINTFTSTENLNRSIDNCGFAYTEALDTRYKLIHQLSHTFVPLSHMNDIIGPITNPIVPHQHTHKIIGVNDLIHPSLLAKAYSILNKKSVTHLTRGIFLRGYGDDSNTGMDELSLCAGGNDVTIFENGEFYPVHIDAFSFGLQPTLCSSITVPEGLTKGSFSTSILDKSSNNSDAINMVLANSALVFHLVDPQCGLKEAFRIAECQYYSHDLVSFAGQIANIMR